VDCEKKRIIARNFFKENPVVSSQVISEYLNVMKRIFKMQKQDLIHLCSLWLEKCSVHPVLFSTIKLAQNLVGEYDFQIFDGIIIAAALEANCDILYSEDMQDGQIVENKLKIINPFVYYTRILNSIIYNIYRTPINFKIIPYFVNRHN
jgi:predicted nucleic acid-binding protein